MMAPPATRDVASGASRPLLVSSVVLTMTVLLIYALIVFPRPFMFSQKSENQPNASPAIADNAPLHDDPYVFLDDINSRHQIPLLNVPYLYKIQMKMFIPWKSGVNFGDQNWNTEANSIMFFTVAKTNKRLQVHFVGLHLTAIHIEDDFGRNITILEVSRAYPHVLDVHTEHELIENMNYSLHIQYTTRINSIKDNSGLHASDYTVDEDTRKMVSTHCQTQSARAVFPCVDVPEAKARFQLTIIHPKGTTAVFNSKEKSSITEGDWVTSSFEQSPFMSTYLFALAISEFQYTETNWKEIRIRVYAEPERIADTALAISVLPKIISFFEEYFGIPCPLQKLDVHEVPSLRVRAMENWGLITSRPRTFLYNAKTNGPSDRIMVMITLAHEITHQWFGNLVTMKWWNNLWLNEGFATLLASKAVRSLGVSEYDYYTNVIWTLRNDIQSPPMSRGETPTFSPDSQFGSSYTKPAAVMRMVEHLVGEESFRQGVQRFLTRFSYSNADHKDLMEALTYAHDSSHGNHLSGQPFTLSEVIETWIYQKGFPLIYLKYREDGVVMASQTSYFGYLGSEIAQQKWKIPLFIRSPKTNEQKVEWLTHNETVAIDLGEDVVLDDDAAVYTRIMYDNQLYSRIIEKLRNDHTGIHLFSRTRLIDDSFTFAENGVLSYGTLFNLVSYLPNEREYSPVSAVHAHIDFLYSRLNLHPRYNELLNFVIELMGPIFLRMQTNPPDENENNGEHSLHEVACRRVCIAGFAPCVNMAVEALKQAKESCGHLKMSNQCNRIKPHLKRCFYSAAVMYGDKEWADFVYKKYSIETRREEKDWLWTGLVASKRKEYIHKAFHDLLLVNLSTIELLRFRDLLIEYSKYYHSKPNHIVSYVDENIEEITKNLVSEGETEFFILLYSRSLWDPSQMPQLDKVLSVIEKKFPATVRKCRHVRGRIENVQKFRAQLGDLIINNVTSVLKIFEPSVRTSPNLNDL